jgi:hypothetical protein
MWQFHVVVKYRLRVTSQHVDFFGFLRFNHGKKATQKHEGLRAL